MLSDKVQLGRLEYRKNLLTARGETMNQHLIAKIDRQIRAIKKRIE